MRIRDQERDPLRCGFRLNLYDCVSAICPPQGAVLAGVGGIGAQTVVVTEAHLYFYVVVEDGMQIVCYAAALSPCVPCFLSRIFLQGCPTAERWQGALGSAIRAPLRVWAHALTHAQLVHGHLM